MIAEIEGRGITRARLSANNHRPTIQPELLQRYPFIPVDFIKGNVIGANADKLLNNKWLKPHFKHLSSHETGEVFKSFCEFRDMRLVIYPSGYISFSGSLHKFWNRGIHNYDDFDELSFYRALNLLYRIFGFKPNQIHLTTLEFGVNLIPPTITIEIIDGCLMHKWKDKEKDKSNDGAKFFCFGYENYTIKLYDKALQYGLKVPILRIEINAKGQHLRGKKAFAPEFKRKGIYTLQDFIDADKRPFVNELVEQWNEIIFADPTANKKGLIHDYAHILHWKILRNAKKKQTISRHRRELKEHNQTQGQNIQEQVSNLIIQKINELQNVTNSTFSYSWNL
jgi:hypothetical protein